MKPVHDSVARLFAATRELTPPITSQVELAAALGVKKQDITNWKARGVSEGGMIRAQRELGISVGWLMDGELPMFVATSESPSAQSQSARQQADILRSAAKLVQAVLDSSVPLTDREKERLSGGAVRMVMQKWPSGLQGDADTYRAALALVAEIKSA